LGGDSRELVEAQSQPPDFHPKSDAAALKDKGDAGNLPPVDLDGTRRTTADIGAYAAR